MATGSLALGENHLIVEAFLDYYKELFCEVKQLLESFQYTNRVRNSLALRLYISI